MGIGAFKTTEVSPITLANAGYKKRHCGLLRVHGNRQADDT
jgi:hypothetical protein